MDANGRQPHDTDDHRGRWGRADQDDLSPETFLITDARDSLEAQHRARVRKYLIMMAFRVPALLIAGIVYSATGSGMLALAIVAISIPLPWMAVLIANDRPPRKRGEHPNYLYGADHDVLGPLGLSRTDGQLIRADDDPSPDTGTTDSADADTDSHGPAASRIIDGHVVDPRADDH
ncbi:DUF3099 domain-containing protein [Gordonia aurantiaca]|uniref:DUF3099 domain-containing protein n=1 Tax=Gordonia sp. B21 TaxID=3151852 RepID=UPI003267D2AD